LSQFRDCADWVKRLPARDGHSRRGDHRFCDIASTPKPPRLPETSALYFDFDGTLVEFAPTPDLVQVRGDLPALLAALHTRQQALWR